MVYNKFDLESDHSKLRLTRERTAVVLCSTFLRLGKWLSTVLSEPLLTTGNFAPVKGLRLLSRKKQKRRVAGALVNANLIWSLVLYRKRK